MKTTTVHSDVYEYILAPKIYTNVFMQFKCIKHNIRLKRKACVLRTQWYNSIIGIKKHSLFAWYNTVYDRGKYHTLSSDRRTINRTTDRNFKDDMKTLSRNNIPIYLSNVTLRIPIPKNIRMNYSSYVI